jgi:hypothetical protein
VQSTLGCANVPSFPLLLVLSFRSLLVIFIVEVVVPFQGFKNYTFERCDKGSVVNKFG